MSEGKNLLALELYRFSDASYLESQDFWRVSGLERDVFVYACPNTQIVDFSVKQSLDSLYRNGIFSINFKLSNGSDEPQSIGLTAYLVDDAGKTVYSKSQNIQVKSNDSISTDFSVLIPDVKRWTAETPNIYRLLVKSKSSRDLS